MRIIRLALLLCLFGIGVPVSAQTFDAFHGKHEFSLNAQGLMSSIGPFGFFPAIVEDRYQPFVRYRLHLGDHAVRIGLSGNVGNGDEASTDSSFSNSRGYGYAVFLGYEYSLTQFGRFHAYTGFDALFGYDQTENEYEQNNGRDYSYQSSENRSGLRPFLGIRIFITPRVSLSSEMSVVAARTFRSISSFRSWDQPQNVDSDSEAFTLSYQYPQIIYLDIRF